MRSTVPNGEYLNGTDQEADSLFEEYFQWRLKDRPQLATRLGFHQYDDQLDDYSLEAFETRLNTVKSFLLRAKKISPRNHIDKTNINAFIDELNIYIDGYHFKGFLLPLNNIQGIYEQIDSILQIMPKNNLRDYNNMVSRLEKTPLQADQILELLRAGMSCGVRSHKTSINKVSTGLGWFIVSNPKDSLLYKYFDPSALKICEEKERKILHERALSALTKISNSFKKLKEYIEEEYQPREEIAISSLPNGQEFYKQCIKYHTSSSLTAEEIHKTGKAEVERITQEIKKTMKSIGHDMSVQEFSEYLRHNESLFYNSKEELLNDTRSILQNRINPTLNQVFHYKEPLPLEVIENPRSTSSTAYHENPSLDGKIPGFFIIGTYDLKIWPRYTLLSLSLHEAMPGHHYQISHLIQNKNIPAFRKIGSLNVNLGTLPSEFPIHAYYIEGWGLYVEKLGFELNLYNDPMEKFGYYYQLLLRACRLVVDTGIHALGWTKADATVYMQKYLSFTKSFIEAQIDRYVFWPGQALSYKIGEIKLFQIRQNTEEKLGSKFNLKDFHEIVLNNFGSLEFLEKEVNEWADSVKC